MVAAMRRPKRYHDGRRWILPYVDLPLFGDHYVHRLNGPAIELDTGTKIWLLNNKTHRYRGPAEEYADGRRTWYYYGQPYRYYSHASPDLVSAVRGVSERVWGDKDGKIHRAEEPAIERDDGRKKWFMHGNYYFSSDRENGIL